MKSPVDNPFSEPGDSGGGVFQGDTAVGVISGGSPKTTFVDEEGNPVGDPFALGWVADLDYALDAADVDITFEDPNEEPPGEDDKDADANAEADAGAEADGGSAAEGAEAEKDGSAGADGEDADASAAAEGDDANASDNADADAKEADASSAAEGDDAEASADADGAEADASAAAGGKDDEADSDADGNEKPVQPDFNKTTVEEGGTITGTAEPNAEVQLTWNSADANAGSSQVDSQAVPAKGSTTVKTDAKGNFSFEAPAEAGVYNYTAVTHASGQSSAPAEFTVTVTERKTEAPAERKLTVEPKEIAASDFVQQDKGVQITAEGFEEGEEVTLKVVNGPEGVKDYQMTETAKADGVVGFSIYGTSASNPEAYLGKYDLEVTGANDTEDESALTGSFQVVADEDGTGGGNDDGNGDGGGSDLPRTGAELTGLAAGAGLLLVGGAAVVLTMRRKKNN
ncbi:LPXTG cell wall anchor domain-containing protein [Brevibacterium permense]|uniref:LPXTG cell wall anchor domain-containing protein n=1 Tax=Brevibacterium permense TaxID=234834 RepID=UPI00315A783D